jgi:RNA polymerase sigma-70 factor (ECF subfamily)
MEDSQANRSSWRTGESSEQRQCWVAFVEATEKPLYGWVCQQLKNPEDARDIVQEAFVRFYKSDKEFQTEAHARNWLYRVAGNLIADRGRERRRHPRLSLDRLKEISAVEIPDPSGEEPGALLEKAEEEQARASLLLAALDRLPGHYRVVLFLRYYMSMKRGEIASILGIKEQDVSNRLHRGLEKLREFLQVSVCC